MNETTQAWLDVVGRGRKVVGRVAAREGLMTNEGPIAGFTPAGQIRLKDGRRFSAQTKNLYVRAGDARRRNYAFERAEG